MRTDIVTIFKRMIMSGRKSFVTLLLLLCCSVFIHAQAKPKLELPNTRILFIFDASQSMAGNWESGRKINSARNILISMIDSLEQIENVSMALRVYGHQSIVPPQDCDDTRLEVPFTKGNAGRIRQELRFLNPKGTTPLAHSLELSANDFPPCPDCRNIVILITDGIEACEGDPCEVSAALQRKGIILKPFIIGIGIDRNFQESFNCIGHFYNAANEEKFEEVLGVVISQALNSTTAQVNLLNINGEPLETNVNMTFTDHSSGKVKYNYIHTINYRGKPDTLFMDHLITYDMKVHTQPPVTVNNIKLSVGYHTIIAVDAPQGELVVQTRNGDNQYRGMQYIVREANKPNTLNIQPLDHSVRYLVGKYDLELPTLPRLIIEDVQINQSAVTKIEIPRPGRLTLLLPSPGYGSLYLMTEKGQEWIYNLDNTVRKQSVLMQPGDYRVVFRAANARQTVYTISKTFKIVSGDNEVLELY